MMPRWCRRGELVAMAVLVVAVAGVAAAPTSGVLALGDEASSFSVPVPCRMTQSFTSRDSGKLFVVEAMFEEQYRRREAGDSYTTVAELTAEGVEQFSAESVLFAPSSGRAETGYLVLTGVGTEAVSVEYSFECPKTLTTLEVVTFAGIAFALVSLVLTYSYKARRDSEKRKETDRELRYAAARSAVQPIRPEVDPYRDDSDNTARDRDELSDPFMTSIGGSTQGSPTTSFVSHTRTGSTGSFVTRAGGWRSNSSLIASTGGDALPRVPPRRLPRQGSATSLNNMPAPRVADRPAIAEASAAAAAAIPRVASRNSSPTSSTGGARRGKHHTGTKYRSGAAGSPSTPVVRSRGAPGSTSNSPKNSPRGESDAHTSLLASTGSSEGRAAASAGAAQAAGSTQSSPRSTHSVTTDSSRTD